MPSTTIASGLLLQFLFGFTIFLVLTGVPGVSARARDKPRNVTVEALNSTVLRVEWLPPRSEDKCSVQRYLIRLKTDTSTRSFTKKVNGVKKHTTFYELTPDTRYFVRVVAVGCRGKSQPTKWAKAKTAVGDGAPRRRNVNKGPKKGPSAQSLQQPMGDGQQNQIETASPGKPSNVRTRTGTDTIMLMWQRPKDEVLVRGYMVGYGEGVPDVNWQYVDANTDSFTIKNLKSSTQYVVSLRAFNNFGKGPVVYDLIYTREIDGPTVGPLVPPSRLKSLVLSPRTVWLEWYDYSLGRAQKITDGRYYIVAYKALPEGEERTVTVKAHKVVLYSLLPATSYVFKVQTMKEDVTTEFSPSVTNTTFEAPPDFPPRNLTVRRPVNQSSTSAQVSWNAPKRTNGRISGYIILYTTNASNPDAEWTVQGILGERTNATVTGMAPNTYYHFKVQARNNKGYSPMSKLVLYKTTKTDHEPDEVSTTSIPTTVPTVVKTGSPINTEQTTVPTEPTAEAEPLEPGETDPLEPMALTSMRFDTQVEHTVRAVVSWGEDGGGSRVPMAAAGGGRVGCTPSPAGTYRNYTITYSTLDLPEETKTKMVMTPFVLLTDLAPNQDYVYEVSSMDRRGNVLWSGKGYLNTG